MKEKCKPIMLTLPPSMVKWLRDRYNESASAGVRALVREEQMRNDAWKQETPPE